jgi:RNA polymerase sigma-70 factor (ECF subfamily)
MADGPLRGLSLLKQLEAEGVLDDYYLFHATHADLLRRAERLEEAAGAYRRALALTQNQVEQAFLRRRLTEIQQHNTGS